MPKILLDSGFLERKDIHEEEYMPVSEHIEKMEDALEILRSTIEEMETIAGRINLQIPPNNEKR